MPKPQQNVVGSLYINVEMNNFDANDLGNHSSNYHVVF